MAMPRSRGVRWVTTLSANANLAGRGYFQAGDHAQQCGLPRSRGTEEDQELAFASFQIHVVDCAEFSLL